MLNEKELTDKKFTNISLLRLISTLFVFVYHIVISITPLYKQYFPLDLTVQSFLFISGFLYANKCIKSIKEFYLKNIIKILIPVIIFVISYFSILGVLSSFNINFSLSFFNLSGKELFSLGHLWFIPAIILCYLITPIIQYVSNSFIDKEQNLNKKLAFFFVFLLAFAVLVNIFLVVTETQMVILPYISGYFFKKYYTKFINKKKTTILFSLILLLISSALFYFVKNYLSASELIITGLTAFIEFVQALSFSVFILITFDYLNKKKLKFLTFSDKYSFSFYLCHHVFLVGTGGLVLTGITNYLWLNLILVFFASIAYSFVVDFTSAIFINGRTQIKQKRILKN